MEYKLNQQAIEAYSLKITQKLSDDFFSKNLTISGQQILQFSKIEQLNLFIISTLFEKWKDETSKLKSPYFNFESNDVKAALKSFMNVLSKNIVVKRVDFDPLVRNAVADTICLALAPYLFIKETYFSLDYPIIVMSDFKERAKFVKHNRAITDVFIKKIEKHNLTSTPLSYALDYLNESYKELVNELVEPTEILALFNAILPIELEQLAIAPKVVIATPKAPDVIESVKEEINEVVVESKPEIVEKVEPAKVEEEVVIKPIAEVEKVKEEPKEELAQPKVEETKKASKDNSASLNQVAKAASSELKSNGLLNKIGLANESVDLTKIINLNQRFMFVNGLFKGENQVFFEALTQLNTFNKYDEAIDYLINTYANKYEWDVDQEEVAELFEFVGRKFA